MSQKFYKKSTKMTSNSRQKKTQNTKTRKIRFLKEYVENADLYINPY